MSAPSVGPDGSAYLSRSLSFLDSVTPAGQKRWTFSDGSIIDHPAVSPDGTVVVAGSRPNFGQPGSVRGWNAATGTLAWQIDLPNENGGYQIAYTRPRFSADSQTAYFGTAILGGGDQFSFLYAVESGTGGPAPPPPPPHRHRRLRGGLADDHELHTVQWPGDQPRDDQRHELQRGHVGAVQREARDLVAPRLGEEDRCPGASGRHDWPDLRDERRGHGHELQATSSSPSAGVVGRAPGRVARCSTSLP